MSMEPIKAVDNLQAIRSRLEVELEEARVKAISALARYKFERFGYWAATWVKLNRVGGFRMPNPFKSFVMLAMKQGGDRK